MLQILIRAVPWVPQRRDNAYAMQRALPGAAIVWDDPARRDAFATFVDALTIAGDTPTLHLEDDITLAPNFLPRVEALIQGDYAPLVGANEVHQFFSKRTTDLTKGTRTIAGRDFSFTCAFYLPQGCSEAATAVAKCPYRETRPTWMDYSLADWLSKKRRSYFNHVPNLVDHNPWPSAIHPHTGPSTRRSPTFQPG